MNNIEFKEGKDYIVAFSPKEVNNSVQNIEIKVHATEDIYSTMYIYLFAHTTKLKIQELCSFVVKMHFPNANSYDVHCK